MPHEAKPKLLYIEDQPLNVALVERILKPSGYELLVANDGTSGIETALCEQPRLILLDMLLPDINGDIVIRHLQNNMAVRHIPVIAVTAYSHDIPRVHYWNMGFAGFLAKPIHRGELLNALATFIGKSFASLKP